MPPAPAPPDREPHRIRLRGPWEWNGADTVRLPFTAPAAGTLARSFNAPTGLEDGTRVRLRVERSEGPFAAELNGRPLTDGEDVTDRLARPNRLTVSLEAGGELLAATLELHLPTGPPG